MTAVQLVGLAASLSLLAGWRLYATVAVVGLALRFELFQPPAEAASLQVLANPWVIGVAVVGALAEALADKVMWLDSLWDAVHTLVRPVGGALLALAVVPEGDPAMQVIAFLLGGGATLLSHTAKAGARAVVNASPEPFSNIAVSATEDVVTLGLMWLVMAFPAAAAIAAAVMAVIVLILLWLAWRILGSLAALFRPRKTAS